LHAVVHITKAQKLLRRTLSVETEVPGLVKYELRTQHQRIAAGEAKISVVTGVSLDKIRQADPER
jgi:hypothetical protein